MLVKPAPGRAIRDPDTMQLVPKEGLEVDETAPFWARALGDHDLVEVKAPAAETRADTPAPPASSKKDAG